MVWDEVTHLNGGLLLSRGDVATWVFTNSFYPPVYDVFTAAYFLLLGPSLLSARLVTVTFAVLTLFVVYAIANLLYRSGKVAMLSVVLFSVMPGIVWLSRMAMIETLLLFVLSLCMLFFFRWLQTGRERDRIISFTALAVGVLVKYQVLVVVPIIMLAATYFLKRDYLKSELKKWTKLPRLAVAIGALAAVTVTAYLLISGGTLNYLLYAFGVGSQQKAAYSTIYPAPIYYLVEVTSFTSQLHPISLLLYAVGLAGLGLMVYRRKPADKLLLLWFIVVYAVFTLIPNREWRYVTVACPVLAIAASTLATSGFGWLQRRWRIAGNGLNRWTQKAGAILLIAVVLVGVYFSSTEAYNFVAADQVQVPVDQASTFVAQSLGKNQTVLVICPLNRLNKYMVSFYLSAKGKSEVGNDTVLQYPALAVDSFTPQVNSTELVTICQQNNVKYALLYDYGGNTPFYNSTLTEQEVYGMLNQTGSFSSVITFGNSPNRIIVLDFNGR